MASATARTAGGLVLLAVLLAGCAGGDVEPAASGTPAAVAGSLTPATTPSSTTATATTLTKQQAAKRYKELADAYLKSRKDLDAALDKEPMDLKAIRAGAKKAAQGYRQRVEGLLDTSWPPDVQPYIDKYVELSGLGLQTLAAAAAAKTTADLLDIGSEEDTRKLNAADAVVRVKLGLPTAQRS